MTVIVALLPCRLTREWSTAVGYYPEMRAAHEEARSFLARRKINYSAAVERFS